MRYMYHVMYRQCVLVSPPRWLYRLTARILELSPFIPYMTRDQLIRVSLTPSPIPLLTPSPISQLHLSNEATPGVPRLEDLGVSPTPLEDKALGILRRYRDFIHYDKSLDELEAPHNKS